MNRIFAIVLVGSLSINQAFSAGTVAVEKNIGAQAAQILSKTSANSTLSQALAASASFKAAAAALLKNPSFSGSPTDMVRLRIALEQGASSADAIALSKAIVASSQVPNANRQQIEATFAALKAAGISEVNGGIARGKEIIDPAPKTEVKVTAIAAGIQLHFGDNPAVGKGVVKLYNTGAAGSTLDQCAPTFTLPEAKKAIEAGFVAAGQDSVANNGTAVANAFELATANSLASQQGISQQEALGNACAGTASNGCNFVNPAMATVCNFAGSR